MSEDHDSEPTVWALTVQEQPIGPPLAEAFIEVGRRWHGELLTHALESGFLLAAGEAPQSTAMVVMRGPLVERLLFVGGRQSWEPVPKPAASPEWRTAARERGEVLVVVVPPGTCLVDEDDPDDEDPQNEATGLVRSIGEACDDGVVLHGTAALALV
ncbi:hypothetical protein [Kitasatospora sp. DSM 101779]|uniref:hypothetical protein n=1 Tax=Kitasatospora sp. DSM 101779 TaxID=2853165 RepID=UPI0021DA057C|nr:hypothetical protein [Kitasatospora sp. DSM 101779]MCU7826827.1 hypothetical protein [Kitasatospora sp. DSM 101779]